MSEPTVSIIVPTHERAQVLEATLAALRSLDYPHDLLEIIVVDDGSTDSTPAIAEKFPDVKYIRQSNRGVASARNRGARLADGQILIFTDDDIVVGRDNVRRHLAVHNIYTQCVVAGLEALSAELRRELTSSPIGRFRLLYHENGYIDEAAGRSPGGQIASLTLNTANMSIGRNLFWTIGGFDERFPVGAEDQDLCWRARAAGAVILRDCHIRVVHNDQHRDLLALCRREERGAAGLVYLARKHPDFPTPPSLALNGPLRRTDSPRVMVRKLVRSAIARPPVLALMHRCIHGVERVRPAGAWPLPYLYRAMTGLYVFRGVRRGMELTARSSWPPAHDHIPR